MCSATACKIKHAAARAEFVGQYAEGISIFAELLARPISAPLAAQYVEPAPAPVEVAADPLPPAVVAAAIAAPARARRPRAERTAPPPAVVAPVAVAPRRADYEPAQTAPMVLLPSQRAAARREPAPVEVAPVAAPAPRRASPAPQAAPAPVASRSPRRQKLATVGIGPGRYAFGYLGKQCEVARDSAGQWFLKIDGREGSRRYNTKRHAVNAARLFIEGAAAAPAPVAAQEAAAVAAAPTPAAAAPPAVAAGEALPVGWRRESITRKQIKYLLHLRRQLGRCGLSPRSPLAEKNGLNRGEASDLIDSLKSQLREYGAGGNGNGGAIQTCNAGPFYNGFCTICFLPQAR